MEDLPEEIVANIFSYLTDGTSAIRASQVCTFFKLVATTQIRKINVNLSTEKTFEILRIQDALDEFRALKKLQLEVSFDVNNLPKCKFCHRFNKILWHLTLREMTFLNPFFDNGHITFDQLNTLIIESSDMTSCSSQLSQFILELCPKLKNLTISGCSGLEIDALNYLGSRLIFTDIEKFELLPTYSYFDNATPTEENFWTIDKLKTLSIRSKLVVMRKNFVRNVIGRRNENLKTLELIATLDYGEPLAPKIIQNYPNLEKLALGKGCTIVRNEDFLLLCNFYQKLKSLEFHFAQSDFELDLRSLQKNESITELALGLTKNVTPANVSVIAKCLPNVTRLSIVLYYLSTSNQEFLSFIMTIFPRITYLEFQRTGMSENMKFTAIQNEIDENKPHSLRHLDDIQNLTN